MIDRARIREGMTVYSADGHKLGKVIECDANTFVVEKGFFFPKDYVARYEDVADVLAEDVRLTRGRDTLAEIGGTSQREGTFSGGSSLMGPSGGIETAPMEEDVKEEARLRRDRELEGRRERSVEQRAATGEDIHRSVEEGGEAQFGEDPGTLGPTRREPEE